MSFFRIAGATCGHSLIFLQGKQVQFTGGAKASGGGFIKREVTRFQPGGGFAIRYHRLQNPPGQPE